MSILALLDGDIRLKDTAYQAFARRPPPLSFASMSALGNHADVPHTLVPLALAVGLIANVVAATVPVYEFRGRFVRLRARTLRSRSAELRAAAAQLRRESMHARDLACATNERIETAELRGRACSSEQARGAGSQSH
jgi:hypothetical protein